MAEYPLRVLLIEDDENDYILTRRMLSKVRDHTFDLNWVPTYAAALETLSAAVWDAVLLDYRLGARDGLELLRTAVANGCEYPIIFLTGLGSYEVDVEAMKAGAADFLVKDQLSPVLLERAIRYAIERKQAAEALRQARDQLEQRVQERTQELAQAVDGLQAEIAERMRVERELRDSEERFRQIAENITEVLWMRDAVNDQTLYVSPRYKALFGLPPDTLYQDPRSLWKVLHPEDRERIMLAWPQQMRGAYDEECRIIRPDGQVRWVRDRAFPIRDSGGKVYRIVGITEDITERKEAEARLRYILNHDVLTGLYNRFYFEEELVRLERGRKFPVSVMSVDVDGLKQVNDRLGHALGDELLRAAAQVLRAAFRNEDLVARIGGDEYVVLLPGAGDEVAQKALARVKDNVAAYNQNAPGLPLSLSIGVATGEKGCALAAVVREADRRMYQDKTARARP